MNNVIGNIVKEIDIASVNHDTIVSDFLQYFEEAGYFVKNGIESLQIIKNNICYPFDVDLIDDEEISIVYSEIVKPDNAKEYNRENGIIYYINTSEKTHLEFPHVHAKYSGETISISLIDYSVIGKYRTRNKQKEAVEYIKRHHQPLIDMWNEIMKV